MPSLPLPQTVLDALATKFGGAPDVVRRGGTPDRARMSETAHLLVRDRRGPGCSEVAVFAKWPSARAAVRRTARRTGAYEREVRFYSELAAGCLLPTPRLHDARFDAADGGFVLLLDDLRDARAGDTHAGPPEDVASTLDAAAALHVRSLRDPRVAAAGWLPDPTDSRVRRQLRHQLNRIRRAVDRERPVGTARWLAALLARNPEGVAAGPAGQPPTLVHGDLHPDQMLFGGVPGGGDVVVDWQTVRRGHAGTDTARAVVLGLPPDERRRHEQDLLHGYRRALADLGGPVPDPADCLADYRCGIAWTAFVNLTHALAVPGGSDSRGDVLLARVAAAARDHLAAEPG